MSAYANRASERRKDRTLKWADGAYKMLYKGFEFKKGKKHPHNPMFKLEFSVQEGPVGMEPITEKLQAKKRLVNKYFVFTAEGYAFEDFLIFLEDLGADLSQCRDELQDPEYKDLQAILQQLELTPPVIEAEIKAQDDNPQYYNCNLKSVPKVFGATAAPVAQPAGPGAPVAPVNAAPAEIIWYVNGTGETVSGTRAEVQQVVNNGYVGQVNINSTGWLDLTAAGFTPAPVQQAPAAPVQQAPAAPVQQAPAAPVQQAPAAPAAFNVDQTDNTLPAATADALNGVAAPAAPAVQQAPAQQQAPAPAAPAAEQVAAPAIGGAVDPFAG